MKFTKKIKINETNIHFNHHRKQFSENGWDVKANIEECKLYSNGTLWMRMFVAYVDLAIINKHLQINIKLNKLNIIGVFVAYMILTIYMGSQVNVDQLVYYSSAVALVICLLTILLLLLRSEIISDVKNSLKE